MKTVVNPRSFLSLAVQPKTKVERIPSNKNDANLTHQVEVFSDYLDVIEALEELELAGLNLGKIKLIASDGWRCHWLCDLIIGDRFNEKLFACDRTTRYFFQQLFEQGKYLLLLTGTEPELNLARQIIARCQVSSEVWYF